MENFSKKIRLFIGGLHPNTTSHELRSVLRRYAPVLDVEVHRDPVSGNSKGFAFFSTRSVEGADKLVQTLLYIRERRLQCQRRSKKAKSQARCKVFVGGLPLHVSDAELRSAFE